VSAPAETAARLRALIPSGCVCGEDTPCDLSSAGDDYHDMLASFTRRGHDAAAGNARTPPAQHRDLLETWLVSDGETARVLDALPESDREAAMRAAWWGYLDAQVSDEDRALADEWDAL
jgi:hypothetical protein